MKPKSLFSSRTFYMQLLSICVAVSGVVPLAPETAAVIVGLLNIGLRIVTKDPVRVGL